MRSHLITGFPGFIGRRLVASLLERDRPSRSSPWSRSGCSSRPRGRRRARLRRGSRSSPATSASATSASPTTSTGGLPARSRPSTTSPRSTTSPCPAEIAQRVNVEGTGNVLDLCRDVDSPRPPQLRQHRLRRGRSHRRRLRARAQPRPGVQEPLRVDQVPGRGLGADADRPDPDDDLPAGDRRRRLAHGRDAEVRRPLLRAALHRRQRRAQDADRQHRPRPHAVQRGPGRLHRRRDGRARADRRPRSARRCISAIPIHSPHTRCSAC